MVRDMRTGTVCDQLEGVCAVHWTAAGTLLYTVQNDLCRPHRVFEHALGTPRARDACVFAEDHEKIFLDLSRTKDGRWNVVYAQSKTRGGAWVRDARAPYAAPFRAVPGPSVAEAAALRGTGPVPPPAAGEAPADVFLSVEHHAGVFYVGVKGGAAGHMDVVRLPLDAVLPDTAAQNPRRTGPLYGADRLLGRGRDTATEALTVDSDMFASHLVLYQYCPDRRGYRLLLFAHAADAAAADAGAPGAAAAGVWAVDLPPLAALHLCANQDYEARAVRYSYSSLAAPLTVCDLRLADMSVSVVAAASTATPGPATTAAATPFWQGTVRYPSGARAAAGTDPRGPAATAGPDDIVVASECVGDAGVPVTLAYRAGLRAPGAPRPPALLCAYGAYGHLLSPDFHFERAWLLRRGWLVALVHVRGGGERGAAWHAAGSRAAKRNSGLDFAAAAAWLHDRGYTAPETTAAYGHSAGALVPPMALHLGPPGCVASCSRTA